MYYTSGVINSAVPYLTFPSITSCSYLSVRCHAPLFFYVCMYLQNIVLPSIWHSRPTVLLSHVLFTQSQICHAPLLCSFLGRAAAEFMHSLVLLPTHTPYAIRAFEKYKYEFSFDTQAAVSYITTCYMPVPQAHWISACSRQPNSTHVMSCLKTRGRACLIQSFQILTCATAR